MRGFINISLMWDVVVWFCTESDIKFSFDLGWGGFVDV